MTRAARPGRHRHRLAHPGPLGRARLLLAAGLCLVSSNLAAFGHDAEVHFHSLPLDSSLSQNTVTDIIQDNNGLLWIATLGGLHRYDGYRFELISSDPRDPNGLRNIDLVQLLADKEGWIWVAGAFYSAGWIDRFHARTGVVERIRAPIFARADAPGSSQVALLQDQAGKIWIGTNLGLHQFDPQTGEIAAELHTRWFNQPIGAVQALTDAADGTLWLATTTGVYSIDPSRQRGNQLPLPAAGTATALMIDSQQQLWIGGEFDVLRYSLEERAWTTLPAVENEHPGTVTEFVEDRELQVWVSFRSAGVRRYHAEGADQYLQLPNQDGYLASSSVWSMAVDRTGLVWVGLAGYGLQQINPSRQRMHKLGHDPRDPNTIANPFIWDLQQDQQGRIYAATPGGLARIDFANARVDNLIQNRGDNHLQSLQFDTRGQLWIGTATGHLYRLPPGSDTWQPWSGRAQGKVSDSRLWYLGPTDRQTLWVGVGEGLFELDPVTEKMTRVLAPSDDIPMGTSSIRVSIAEPTGGYWFGGGGAGLIHFDRELGVTAQLGQLEGESQSLSNNHVRSMYLGADGRLWVGTHNGLNMLSAADREAKRNRFRLFTVTDGLPNNTVYGVTPDPDGVHLWLSTNAGLSRFHTENWTFENFSAADGLSANEFNGGAELAGHDGKLYFGTVNGLSWFDPTQLRTNPAAPDVLITAVRCQDGFNLLDMDADSQLVLPHKRSGLQIRFAAADFHQPGKNRFRYRLLQDGEPAPWQSTDEPEVRFAGLQPGDYRFEVHASNNDGVWSLSPAVLPFTVAAPWWWNRSAWLIYALALVFGFTLYHHRQRLRLRAERQLVQQLAQKEQMAIANQQMAMRYAHFDQLTQLPNRESLLDELAERMRRCRQENSRFALMLIDLDRFKRVNDRLGHSLADRILQRTAERLQNNNPGGYLARISSDEFALLLDLPTEATADWVQQQADSQHRCLAYPFELGDPPIHLGATIGVAVYGGGADSPTDLLGHADLVLHDGKIHGSGQTHIYQPGMREQVRERLGIEARISGAMENGELRPHYQPILRIADETVASFEALIRWFPHEGPPIFPDQFIPLAEDNGQIVELGRWMLQQVAAQTAAWRRAGLHKGTVAVNVSMRQLLGGDLVQDLKACLRDNSLPGNAIKLEITESAMMENVQDTADQLRALRALGVQLSIDDFGTGFSSLAHLKLLPVDEMKIDRSFVSDLASNAQSRKLVESIVHMARGLDLRTVAEGVEDQQSLDILRELGCDMVQGYFYAKPMSAEALEQAGWLARNTRRPRDAQQ